MIAFVYAHRHNKDDKFIVEAQAKGYIDFSIVRDVMYRYSKKAQDRFFDNAIESYFFAKFALVGKQFILNKDKSMTKDSDYKVSKLVTNTNILSDLAIKSLEAKAKKQDKDQKMIQFFINDLQAK